MRPSRLALLLHRALLAAPVVACGGRVTPDPDASSEASMPLPPPGDEDSGDPFVLPDEGGGGEPCSKVSDTYKGICSWEVRVTGNCAGTSCYEFCHDKSYSWVSCSGPSAGVIQCNACNPPGPPGRGTEGIERRAPDFASTGDFFAWMAWGEGASVHAFDVLERELRAHRAPRALVRGAVRARNDEKRHVRIAARIARAYGARVEAPAAPERRRARSLSALANENVAEACVGETWYALLAAWQAEHAAPRLRPSLRRIAQDELRHAALGWSIAAWLDRKSPRDRSATAKRAIAALRDGAKDPAPTLKDAGLPTRAQALAMLATLEASLWSV